MITHSTTFENLAKAPVKQSDVIVARQLFDGTTYSDDATMILDAHTTDLGGGNYLHGNLMSVGIDSVGQMLGAATKKATVKLLGIVSGINADDLFQIRLGLYNSDPSVSGYDYISQGFYLVDTVDYNYDAKSTTVTMYDHMWKAGEMNYGDTVNTGDITYPATLEEFAEAMATKIGATLMSGFASLPNSQHTILEDLYSTISNATVQTAIQELAAATGTTARMTDTTLTFVPYSLLSENLNSDSLKTLKIGNTYGPINSVVLGRVPQNDNVALYTPNLPEITLTASASTNLFTAVNHHLVDGNIVQLQSTGTLPAPLLTTSSYYVFTNGSADTFALAPTYNDAIAGTNLIDLTSAGTGTITTVTSTTQEIQINNNEILDDDRGNMVAPIYNALSGNYWTEVTAETIGLGWHEVGDLIRFTQGTKTVRAFLSEVHLTLAGSIKEKVVSIIPDVFAINRQTAGGILKTLYNAEIKVDKQANEITSIVEEQAVVNGEVQDTFTELQQTIDAFSFGIQSAGGNNLILNSVGYATDATNDAASVSYRKLTSWDYVGISSSSYVAYTVATHGTVTSSDSSVSQQSGGVSGRSIHFSSDFATGKGIQLSQTVAVAVGTPLSFGVRAYNVPGTGTATITLSNTNESQSITISSIDNLNWDQLVIEDFVTTLPWVTIKIEAKTSALELTDLTLMYGTTVRKWTQADTEIMSSNVQFNKDGIRVYDPVKDMETHVTNSAFQTIRRSDGVILLEADNTGVRANDFTIRGSSDYYTAGKSVIKQITIPLTDSKGGIAFLKGTE